MFEAGPAQFFRVVQIPIYVDGRKFSVFVMVSELLEKAEERRDGTEKDFLRFWRQRCA